MVRLGISGGIKILEELATLLIENEIDISTLEAVEDESGNLLFFLPVPGLEVFNYWEKLRGLVEQSGYWPIIIEELDAQLEMMEEYEDQPDTAASIIAASEDIKAVEWLNYRYEHAGDGLEGFQYPRGEWPDNPQPKPGFFLSEQPEVRHLALVPTSQSWQVPAYLKFGNWSYCPAPEEHASVFKRWGEQFGAEIVWVEFDTLEVMVWQPPQDKETAIRLAEEQFSYCPLVVYQGPGTIEALAGELLNSKVWSFWWE